MWLRIVLTAVLLAVLGGAYYYFESGDNSGKETKKKEKPKLLDFTPGDVTAFTIKKPDGSSVSLNKFASDWKITDPVKTPADQSMAGQVVSTAASLLGEKDLGAVSDPAEFGLSAPVTLTFVLSGNQTKILEIGDKTPNGSEYYVMAGESGRVYTVDGRSAESMLKSLLDLRNRKLMPFDTLATVSFEIEIVPIPQATKERTMSQIIVFMFFR